MNRQQIRKLAKEYKIPFKTLKEQIKNMDPEIVKINLEDLPDGEKVKIKPRSHILRLNDAQLSDIIMFSTFFESKYLQDEWINGMFTSDARTKS